MRTEVGRGNKRGNKDEKRRGKDNKIHTFFIYTYIYFFGIPTFLLFCPLICQSCIFTFLLPPLLSLSSPLFTSPSLPLSLCLYTPLPPSSACLSQPLLFMKVNLQVYQELLAGGGLRCSNHNKASPATWNRNSIVGILSYFHHRTLHMMLHSHLPLSTNEHPCFLPAFPFGSCLALSCS